MMYRPAPRPFAPINAFGGQYRIGGGDNSSTPFGLGWLNKSGGRPQTRPDGGAPPQISREYLQQSLPNSNFYRPQMDASMYGPPPGMYQNRPRNPYAGAGAYMGVPTNFNQQALDNFGYAGGLGHQMLNDMNGMGRRHGNMSAGLYQDRLSQARDWGQGRGTVPGYRNNWLPEDQNRWY